MKFKKIAAMITAAALMGTIAATASARTFKEGGKFTAADAPAILKHVTGIRTLTGEELDAADLDGDGHITAKDATLVLKKVVGLPTSGDTDVGYVTIQGVKYDIAATVSVDLHGLTGAITNEDVKKIGKLKNLTKLTLTSAQISDISPLIGLTNLAELYLYENQISDSDLESLKSALPNCNII